MKWMAILILMSSIPRDNVIYDHVDFFEINHVYDDEGKLVLDQVVMWDWVTHEGKTEKKVVAWHLLKDCREVLTPEEFRKKNMAFQEAWRKEYGTSIRAPDYVPEFLGHRYCPRKDHRSNTWIMIIPDHKITANACMETWTQYDSEIENRKLFSKESRRGLGKRIKLPVTR